MLSISISTALSTGLFTKSARPTPAHAFADAEADNEDRALFSQEALALAKQALYQRHAASRGLAAQGPAGPG